MLMGSDYEMRTTLVGDPKVIVMDLDVQWMRSSNAFHNSTKEEGGPSVDGDLTRIDLEQLMEVREEC